MRNEAEKRLYRYSRQMSQSKLFVGDSMDYLYSQKDIHSNSDVVRHVNKLVLGPAMNLYIIWVLKQAVQSGKKRLYFLAREGYMMYQAACIYCEQFGLKIDCRYIYCSRYSLRIPMYHLNQEAALDCICRGGIDVTMEKILSRAGIAASEIVKIIQMADIPYHKEDIIPHAKLDGIKRQLMNCDYFLDSMNKVSKEALPAAEGYLQQVGFLEDIPDAIVDSGWIGSMQQTLNQLLHRMGRKRSLEGYYWGLYELPEVEQRDNYHSFYFKPEGCLNEKVYFSNCLFEEIFGAPHGMTIKYVRQNGCYSPLCAEVDKSYYDFIRTVEKDILSYIKSYAKKLDRLDSVDCVKEKKIVHKNLALFMARPTRVEAEIYGSMLFSDDMLENHKQEIGIILNEKELRKNHLFYKALTMTGIRKGCIRESAWYEGSAVRSSPYARYHCFWYVLYKYLLYLRKNYLWRKRYG